MKKEVTKLSNFLKIQQQRLKAGLPVTSQSLHFVFTGKCGCRFIFPPWNLVASEHLRTAYGYDESRNEGDLLGVEVDASSGAS